MSRIVSRMWAWGLPRFAEGNVRAIPGDKGFLTQVRSNSGLSWAKGSAAGRPPPLLLVERLCGLHRVDGVPEPGTVQGPCRRVGSASI